MKKYRTCSKCNNRFVEPEYESGVINKRLFEFFRLECECGHYWTEDAKDKKLVSDKANK